MSRYADLLAAAELLEDQGWTIHSTGYSDIMLLWDSRTRR